MVCILKGNLLKLCVQVNFIYEPTDQTGSSSRGRGEKARAPGVSPAGLVLRCLREPVCKTTFIWFDSVW